MQIDETISLTIGEADRGIRVILRVHLELQKLVLDLFHARPGLRLRSIRTIYIKCRFTQQ